MPSRSHSIFLRLWWLWSTLIIVIVIFFVLYKIFFPKPEPNKIITNSNRVDSPEISTIDPDHPPQFIQADFVELDKVYDISKFRSGFGHDFSYLSGETCRSMKHYFSAMDSTQPFYKYEGLPIQDFPAPTVERDVKIFSPVDGTMSVVNDDGIAYNGEIQVVPDAYPNIVIRLMHVQKAPLANEGKVRAGEFIGLVFANQSFDLAIQADLTNNGEKKIGYISYFAALPDSLFANYQARGIQSREDLIITKEYRDAHLLTCHDKEVFDNNYPQVDGRSAHVVELTGFKEMEAALQAKYPNPDIVITKDTLK